MKITAPEPLQTLVCAVLMLMLGATVPVTVIVIELLVAELVVLQVAILVSSHNITSLFDSEAFEYVD